MALFPRCNNPVSVVGRHGATLVGCHSCIQCRVAYLMISQKRENRHIRTIFNTEGLKMTQI